MGFLIHRDSCSGDQLCSNEKLCVDDRLCDCAGFWYWDFVVKSEHPFVEWNGLPPVLSIGDAISISDTER